MSCSNIRTSTYFGLRNVQNPVCGDVTANAICASSSQTCSANHLAAASPASSPSEASSRTRNTCKSRPGCLTVPCSIMLSARRMYAAATSSLASVTSRTCPMRYPLSSTRLETTRARLPVGTMVMWNLPSGRGSTRASSTSVALSLSGAIIPNLRELSIARRIISRYRGSKITRFIPVSFSGITATMTNIDMGAVPSGRSVDASASAARAARAARTSSGTCLSMIS
mmetsp:Transcript_14157/g.59647  ORF Transcript_14157/g.59647 Transcript_14157/m.59647 type:complete len:226 (-) Transcript_14157:228-905(-)